MNNKIALFGRMGSGKSDLGARLGFYKVAWGDAVKEEFMLYGIGSSAQKIDKAVDRPFLQNYGQLRRGELHSFTTYNNAEVEIQVTNQGKEARLFFSSTDPRFVNGPCEILGPCYYDYWVDKALPKIKTLLEVNASVLNDDIRRWNEWRALKQLDFTMIKVETSEKNRIERMKLRDGAVNMDTLEDISESEIDELPYDVLINNNDTIDLAWNSLLDVIK